MSKVIGYTMASWWYCLACAKSAVPVVDQEYLDPVTPDRLIPIYTYRCDNCRALIAEAQHE